MIGELFKAMFAGVGMVNINGVSYTGQNIHIIHDDVFVDGVRVGSNIPDRSVVVNIVGDVTRVQTHSGNVNISGSAGQVSTSSGDVSCSHILGDLSTYSGDVVCHDVSGDIRTYSGDIIKRK